MSEKSLSARTPAFLSVVLSFFNEEAVIPELLQRLRAVCGSEIKKGTISGYEFVFVNDHSSDKSEQVLRDAIEKVGDVVLINMSRNFGNSECVFAGLRNAIGDAVIYMDADLQDPPEVITRMLEAWQADNDVEVVYTTRLSRAGEHPLKLLITKFGYRLINAISDLELPVDSGDFKLLSRRAVEYLLKIEESRPYMRGLVSWIGFKQVQIPYHRESRYDGRLATKYPVFSRRVIWGYLDRALISFSDVPLKLCLFVGFLMSCLSGLYLCVVIVMKIGGWVVPGWSAIMATVLLLGGVQLTLLGVVGLYINIIFLEVKHRPNYIIDTIVHKRDGKMVTCRLESPKPGEYQEKQTM